MPSNIFYFQPGYAYRRYKIRDYYASYDTIHSCLYFDREHVSYYTSVKEFQESLTYDERGYVFDYYYTPVKVKQIAEYLYVVSIGQNQHMSMTYANRAYRNSENKWVEGWKGNIWGMSHNYCLDGVACSSEDIQSCLDRLKQYELKGHCVFTWKRDRPRTQAPKVKHYREYEKEKKYKKQRHKDFWRNFIFR